jgi:hypothetical protein
MFIARYTWRESAETISPPKCCASATPSAVFPTAVGPTIARSEIMFIGLAARARRK